ncbi:MAG: hypothetical protein WAL34_17420 [Acidobacteriaceae bacterium]
MTTMRCPSSKAVIRRRFYIHDNCHIDSENAEVQLIAREDWICITEPEAESLKIWFDSSDRRSEQSGRLPDATAAYLSDSLTNEILRTQFWVTSSAFPVAQAGQAVAVFNDRLNEFFADQVKVISLETGTPILLADVVSGITAELVLEPIEKPLMSIRLVFEAIGLAAGILTSQPALMISCAKALAHYEIQNIVEHTIGGLVLETTTPEHNLATIDAAEAARTEAEWELEAGI